MTIQSQLITIEKLAKVLEGWKPGEMYVIAGGRQTGKSYYYQTQMMNSITNMAQEYLAKFGNPNEPKYKFSRANWYQAEFNPKDYFEVDAWCEQHFGKHPTNPDAWSRWKHKSYEDVIMFRDEKDYVLFMLRWS